MAVIHRIRATWTGFSGAPGVSTFYTAVTPVQADVDAIRAFFNSISTYLPNPVRITVDRTGDSIEATTGTITGSWTVATPPAQVSGAGGTSYSAPAGGLIRWKASAIVNGRRPSGRTFLVPLATAAYDTDGTIQGTALTALQSAATTLLGAVTAGLVVWSRPFAGNATTAARVGSSPPVTGTSAVDKAVVLRSRRD